VSNERSREHQLHFNEPFAYSAIYSNASKVTKDPLYYSTMVVDESSFGYIDNQKAKIRRDVLSPLFSRRSIVSLQGLVAEKVCSSNCTL
jgi:hypothetical protein